MKNYITALILSLLVYPVVVTAQDQVEEIIVTATKTEKTLQEVPVAVSVVTADTIEKAGITDMFVLKAVVPSLETRQSQSSTNETCFVR